MTGAGRTPNLAASLRDVSVKFGATLALDNIDLDIPAGQVVGLIGPDGAGKSSLLWLIAGARAVQSGRLEVLGGDMARASHRRSLYSRIAFMPQGLGRNLYPTLSVAENIDFFARQFGYGPQQRRLRVGELAEATGLLPFIDRPAGKLSGGMRQKLALCCALVSDPDLLILDEPTTGVDALARRQFWDLLQIIRASRAGMTILFATAYMDEAARFDHIAALHLGRVLAFGSLSEVLARTNAASLEDAYARLMPSAGAAPGGGTEARPADIVTAEIAIEAENLSMRFGDFTAVDRVSFRIRSGEIFGFLGSNGCGKTTTMKMLTGLLPASEGRALLFGRPVDEHTAEARKQIGYMSQSFSLYRELTVRQNLELHARLFDVPETEIAARVAEAERDFGLAPIAGALPDAIPLGQRQRLSLAVAMIHRPRILILDEPTSGVDPATRDRFWDILTRIARRDRVTIFVSTHLLGEAERCDRVSLMHAGRVLASDTPEAIKSSRRASTLEEAFISFLREASELDGAPGGFRALARSPAQPRRFFDPRRMWSYTHRELLELRRDPIRATLALIGSIVLLVVIGYGINFDVKDLRFAVLDLDRTAASRDYILNISGSRYFIEEKPIESHAELDRRMREGDLAVALEIPHGFARDMARGRPVAIGVWVDGAMPQRAETTRSYILGMHQAWLAARDRPLPVNIETRFRYNPDIASIVAMVPATIPLVLLMIPAMLASLSVVREKELGSIINFYVTPVTRTEFMLGKQLVYILVAMLNFVLLVLVAIFFFGVPVKGSLLALAVGALLHVSFATGFGLLCSTFMRSQIAAMFGTTLGSMIPAMQFSGMMDPISSLQGIGAWIGSAYPMTYALIISRGVFSKALGFSDLSYAFWALAAATPVVMGAAIFFLRKQER